MLAPLATPPTGLVVSGTEQPSSGDDLVRQRHEPRSLLQHHKTLIS
jgi:hypothetical protein